MTSSKGVRQSAHMQQGTARDAMRRMELFMALEEEFDCTIPDNITERIITVGDATSFITEKTG